MTTTATKMGMFMLSEFIEIVVGALATVFLGGYNRPFNDGIRLPGRHELHTVLGGGGPSGGHVFAEDFLVGCFQIQVRWTLQGSDTTSSALG
jgi:NADH:ubiquinone oxidoreductase subunit H